MSNVIYSFQSSILVAIGAAFGASLRIYLYLKFTQYKKHNLYYINLVNTLATFLLGLTLAIQTKLLISSYSNAIYLFICVGFLGTLSTFSSMIYEISIFLDKQQWKKLFIAIILSMSLGIAFGLIGYYFGNI